MSRCTQGVPSCDEALEELRRGDRPGRPAADVRDVGDAALQRLVVGRRQRHPPRALALGLGGGEEGVAEPVVVGEDPGLLVAERDDDRAGERREIDDAASA